MKITTALVGVLAATTALSVHAVAVLSKTQDTNTTIPIYNASEAIDIYPDGGPRPSMDIPIDVDLIKSEPSDPVKSTERNMSIARRGRDGNQGGYPWSGGLPGDWRDAYGPVSTGYFTVVFTLTRARDAQVVIYREKSSAIIYRLRCDPWCPWAPGSWNNLRGWMPWVVVAHSSGDWCDKRSGDDNLWIKYSNQAMNVVDDARCERTINLPLVRKPIVSPSPTATATLDSAPAKTTNYRPKYTAHKPVQKRYEIPPWPYCPSERDSKWDEENPPVTVPWQKAPYLRDIHTHRCILAICPGKNKFGAPDHTDAMHCLHDANATHH